MPSIGKALGSKVRSPAPQNKQTKIPNPLFSRHLTLRSTLSPPAKSRPHLPYFLVKEKQNGQGKPSFPSSFSMVQAVHRAGSLPLNLLTAPEAFCDTPSLPGESFALKIAHFGINGHGGGDFCHVLPIPHITVGTAHIAKMFSGAKNVTASQRVLRSKPGETT